MLACTARSDVEKNLRVLIILINFVPVFLT